MGTGAPAAPRVAYGHATYALADALGLDFGQRHDKRTCPLFTEFQYPTLYVLRIARHLQLIIRQYRQPAQLAGPDNQALDPVHRYSGTGYQRDTLTAFVELFCHPVPVLVNKALHLPRAGARRHGYPQRLLQRIEPSGQPAGPPMLAQMHRQDAAIIQSY